jgi:RNA polymerase sigma factor (sigma-70 family)
MNEQTLYTSLLKAVIIGKLSYANSLAMYYVKWLQEKEIDTHFKPKIIEQLKIFYGTIMNPEDELEMENLFNQTERDSLILFLRNLEEEYKHYFLNQVAKRRNKVDTIYTDVFDRTNYVIEDDDIKEIKLAESNKNTLLAGKVWQRIVENERKAITHFYYESFSKVNHFVISNSGSQDDTNDVWAKSKIEFLHKLEKSPTQNGYYEWRPITMGNHSKTSIFTYFIRICTNRWLDMLRQLKKEKEKKEALNLNETIGYPAFIEKDYEDLEKPSDRIIRAIKKLPESYQKIIMGKYFGGTKGIGLTSKELSLEIGLSVGYINNIHKSCLNELRIILKSLNG